MNLWLGPAPEAPFCPARLHSNWRWFYDYSGGNITDFGAHHLDIVQWALGQDESGPVEFFDLKAEWPAPGSLYNTAPKFSFAYRYADGTTVRVMDKQDFGAGISFEGELGTGALQSRQTRDQARFPAQTARREATCASTRARTTSAISSTPSATA
jgi:predicted dehydrogenase